MSNLKILMADDEPEILGLMAHRIAIRGYDIIMARDGEEAWAKIQNDLPDVILLDLIMPKLSGFEVLANLRKNPPSKKWQPVIIVSAHGELENVKKGIELEAEHYMTKPCSIDDILKAIKLVVSLIPQHKSSSELQE